jgi:hypothetical protein
MQLRFSNITNNINILPGNHQAENWRKLALTGENWRGAGRNWRKLAETGENWLKLARTG